MTFHVQMTDAGQRELESLPPEVQTRVLAKLRHAAADPARFFRRLWRARMYRLRVGDYRVLVDILAPEKVIRVQHVGHRKNIYGRPDR